MDKKNQRTVKYLLVIVLAIIVIAIIIVATTGVAIPGITPPNTDGDTFQNNIAGCQANIAYMGGTNCTATNPSSCGCCTNVTLRAALNVANVGTCP